MKNMMKKWLITIMSFMLVACATTGTKDKNNIVGMGSEDVLSQDKGLDSKGSDSNTIEGLTTVYFSHDQYNLSSQTRQMLMDNIRWIRENQQVKRVELEGHCDSTGSEAYNIGLGRRRAEAVKNFLISNGLTENQLSVVSYGEERPISQVNNSKNRRVNFVPLY